jgi:soluble lytic murein transglycosylase-like protein
MNSKRQKKQGPEPKQSDARALERRYRVLLVITVLLALLSLTVLLTATPLRDQLLPGDQAVEEQTITNPNARLSSIFTPEVLHWRTQIQAWAQEYYVNPNVIAIVIQIESCGGPTAISFAGAVGLMQVMPFHFDNGENMLNPDTNVRRGMSVFYECLTVFADWDLGLALACYNGGPSVTLSDPIYWAEETRYYYRWATGLWDDVTSGNNSSETLTAWLDAGGAGMCQDSAVYLSQ